METEAATGKEKHGQGAQVLTPGGPPAQEAGIPLNADIHGSHFFLRVS